MGLASSTRVDDTDGVTECIKLTKEELEQRRKDKPVRDQAAEKETKEKAPPASEEPTSQNPKPDDEQLTIYDPNSTKNIERQRQIEEVRRLENAARDAQNAQILEERSVGHIRPRGDEYLSPGDTVYQQVPVIDSSMAERLLAVKALAQDSRVPASLGNQVITLLLSVDPKFTNIGPIVAQAEKILEEGGANKKLFSDVADAEKVTKNTESLTVKTEENINQKTENGKAYRQDELVVKIPDAVLGEKKIVNGGNVNMLVAISPKGPTSGASSSGSSVSAAEKRKMAEDAQSLADQLLAGLVLRTDGDGEAGGKRAPARGIASVSDTSPQMKFSEIRAREVARSSRSFRTVLGGAVMGFGLLLALGLAIRRAAKLGSVSVSSVLTQIKGLFLPKSFEQPVRREPSVPDPATSATKVVSSSKPSSEKPSRKRAGP